jgi:5'-nucleotidase
MSNPIKILYIDMDGVLVDFESEISKFFNEHPHLKERYKNNPDHIHGIFRNPKPIDGAVEAIHKLYESGKYEMFIATAAPWGNPEAATDKRYWIEKYFGNIFHKKMFVTHRKDLLMGDYLIDDRTKNGAGEFSGKLIQFGWNYEEQKQNPYPNWDSVLVELL